MTDFSESMRRLGKLASDGKFDLVQQAMTRGNPALAELGIPNARIESALNADLPMLESASGITPPLLEAIILLSGRPPLVVQGGIVQGKTTLGDDFPSHADTLITSVERFLPWIGRIEFLNHDQTWGGTGWIVDRDGSGNLLVATNRHVAQLVARRTMRGDGVYLAASFSGVRYRAQIDFGEESGGVADPGHVLELERFTYIADDISADVAIARITLTDGQGKGLEPLSLADRDGDDKEMVAVVGYPAADPWRNNATAMETYFRGLYDVKRFAPGFLRVHPGATILSHDCTTLGGNSGSPVISLDQKAVVGLHFAGEYAKNNSAVRVSTLKAILAQQKAVPGTEIPAAPAVVAADNSHDAASLANRTGYDPDFLQVETVPLPEVPSTLGLDLARPGDATPTRPHELRYQHFGVLYSLARKNPVVAAQNLDGARFRPLKRGPDVWFHDPRIARAAQLDKSDYGDAEIDRGHMVRRADTNWGDTDEEARLSDLDSFHYTNASPQHADLNRSPTLWLGLENYLLKNTRTHGFRACIFTGPVHADDDPEFNSTGATLPMSFWKVVAMLAEDDAGSLKLHATAYVLSQGRLIQRFLGEKGVTEAAEGFAFGAFKTFQVRIGDLEAMTGLGFGALRNADPLAQKGAREGAAFEAKPLRLLTRFEEAVL